MTPMRELDLAYDLLPGFGFYAPQGSLRLTVDIKRKLKRISIFFDAGRPKIFAFPSINLIAHNGKEIPKADVIASAVASSVSSDMEEDVLKRVISGHGFRSAKELRPDLTILFKEPLAISRLMLGNRPGVAGKEARHICVNGYAKSRMAMSFRNITPQKMVNEMHAIHKKLGIALPKKGQSLKAHCETVLEAVNASLDAGKRAEWSARQLGQFLPLFDEAPEVTPFRIRLMGEIIAKQLGQRAVISTRGLAPLGVMLNTHDRLQAAMAEANRLLSARRGHKVQMVAGKHAVQESRLMQQKDGFLRALDQIFPAMQACGVQPMLAYGTLLGAVREGGFLAHDDDVDLLYFDGSKTRAEAMGRRMALVEKLGAYGFRLTQDYRNANFHVTNGEARLDLFPCWQEGRKLQVMQTYPTYVPIPAGIVLPPGQVRIYDRTYPAPANPEAFLKWRYGAGWSTPDPYHEWPWKMEKI